MGTYNEDIARGAEIVKAVTSHEVIEMDGSLYVNFDFYEALVIEPIITPTGLRWQMTAYQWDRTHGVAAEKEIGVTPELYLGRDVKAFLDVQDENARALQEMIDAMPEDL